jgi:hypothetical protein
MADDGELECEKEAEAILPNPEFAWRNSKLGEPISGPRFEYMTIEK